MLRFFPCILHLRIKKLEYAESNYLIQKCLITLLLKNLKSLIQRIIWNIKINFQFLFLDIFDKKMLYTYTENSLNFYIHYKAWINLSLKTISRYCPIKIQATEMNSIECIYVCTFSSSPKRNCILDCIYIIHEVQRLKNTV
jgi:hypothetical protein